MNPPFHPLVTVIIAGRGPVAGPLGEQLRALAGQDFAGPWELLIADNGIIDDISPLVAEFSAVMPEVRVIAADQYPGRSYAVNLAVRQARSSRLITLDCDDVVAPDYLQAMNAALNVHDFVGARLETAALNPLWLQARRRPLQSEYLEPLLGGHHLAVIGAGMAFTRSAFDRVDGFDQGMIALEDLDISYRLQQAGIQPVFVPEAVVHYRYRDSLPGVFRQERNYARYEVLLHRKHRDTLAARRLSRMLRGWGDVLVTAVKVGTRAGQAQFITALGAATGRLEGSLRYRMFHL